MGEAIETTVSKRQYKSQETSNVVQTRDKGQPQKSPAMRRVLLAKLKVVGAADGVAGMIQSLLKNSLSHFRVACPGIFRDGSYLQNYEIKFVIQDMVEYKKNNSNQDSSG